MGGERLTIQPGPEHLLPTEEQAEPLREGEPKALHAEAAATPNVEQVRSVVEQQAEADNPLQKLQAAEKAQEEPQNTHVNQELKQITLKRELKSIQHKLPAAERTLSKLMHQPAVRAASEVTGKSLSRPSGLLGGGLMAFIGSAGYLYLTKHVGFTYNYFVFFILFVAGFALGLVLELVVWTLTMRHRGSE